MGFIVATLFTGIFSDWVGNRLVLQIAGMFLCIGLAGVSLVNSLSILMMLMSIIGLGLGAIEVGANGLIVELHRENPGRYLNLLATFHGTGSFLVPLYVAWLLHWNVGWRSIFLTAVILSGILTMAFVMTPYHREATSQAKTQWNWGEVLRVGFTGQMAWYYLLITSYVAVELGVGAWLMEYLQQVRGQSVAQSSYYLSGFFAMIMFGRFIGSFVVEQLGYMRVVGVALLGGTACLIAGFSGLEAMILALPISGAFFSIIFPTVTAVVTNKHQENVGTILGIFFTFGGLGGALGPWTIGVVSQAFGLQWGLSMTIGFCVVAIVALVVLHRSASTMASTLPTSS